MNLYKNLYSAIPWSRKVWEQKIIGLMVLPIRFSGILLGVVLRPIYMILMIGTLPLMSVLFVMNIFWLIPLMFIFAFCKISLRLPFMRPVSFVFALPFLLFGDFVNTISPVPSPSVFDAEAKIVKWNLIENFPYSFKWTE